MGLAGFYVAVADEVLPVASVDAARDGRGGEVESLFHGQMAKEV